MSANAIPITVRPFASAIEFEQRQGERHRCALDATTRPLEAQDSLSWGANVRDISANGIGLSLCYPFRTGAYLAIDLTGKSGGRVTTILTRVVHAREQTDGSWHLGCEFVKPLTQQELETVL